MSIENTTIEKAFMETGEFITDAKGRQTRSFPKPHETSQLYDVFHSRHSCRQFITGKAVLNEDIDRILDMVCSAPSAGGRQGFEIVVIRKSMEQLANACHQQNWMKTANTALIFLADPERSIDRYGERARDLYSIQDATIAATYCMLAIEQEGLATCWVGAFDEKEVSSLVKARPGVRPVAILPVGYPQPSEDSKAIYKEHKTRKLDDLVSDEQSGRKFTHHTSQAE